MRPIHTKIMIGVKVRAYYTTVLWNVRQTNLGSRDRMAPPDGESSDSPQTGSETLDGVRHTRR